MVRLSQDYHTTQIPICLSQGFYSCTNIMTKKQVGEERVYLAYSSALLFIMKGSQDWNSSRSGSRSWWGGMVFTGLLPLACSACSLTEPKSTNPEMAPPTMDPPPLITNWENAPQLYLMEALPQLKLCVKLTQNQPVRQAFGGQLIHNIHAKIKHSENKPNENENLIY